MSSARRLLQVGARFKSDRRGTIAVLVALASPVIVGMCGFGAEMAYWQYSQRTLQGAADAAAFSAAAQIAQGYSTEQIETAGQNAAYASGLKVSRASAPAIAYPPSSGGYTTDTKAVEVVLVDNIPRQFTRLFFDDDTVAIRARSVAKSAGARPACVLALNSTAGRAVSFAGSSTLELMGCDVASNSIADDSVDFSGATSVTTECVSAVGGVDGAPGSLTLTDCAAPFEHTRRFPDPYQDLSLPLMGSCDSALKAAIDSSPSDNVVVNPGTICASGAGGSTVRLAGTVHFNPGVYVFEGVNFRINSTATVTGAGVTFIFRSNAEININGGADIELSAPTASGNPYQGILLFGDRTDTGVTHVLNGNSATSFTGVLYFPGSDVTFSGTNDTDANACTILVADEIEFIGNSFFGSDCTSLGVEEYETAQVVLIVE